jgi:hypothetical protein
MRVGFVRLLSLLVPIAYGLGVLILSRELGPKEGAIGAVLIFASALAVFIGLMVTGVGRVVQEHVEHLDEAERLMRDKVLSRAYGIFTLIMVIALVYADIAADLNRKYAWTLPLPQADVVFSTLAVILLAVLLPSALLAWRLPLAEPDA